MPPNARPEPSDNSHVQPHSTSSVSQAVGGTGYDLPGVSGWGISRFGKVVAFASRTRKAPAGSAASASVAEIASKASDATNKLQIRRDFASVGASFEIIA